VKHEGLSTPSAALYGKCQSPHSPLAIRNFRLLHKSVNSLLKFALIHWIYFSQQLFNFSNSA
jgi:hypothetical protein